MGDGTDWGFVRPQESEGPCEGQWDAVTKAVNLPYYILMLTALGRPDASGVGCGGGGESGLKGKASEGHGQRSAMCDD